MERIIKKGRKRERGEEGKRQKKGKKKRRKEKKKINHSTVLNAFSYEIYYGRPRPGALLQGH
jgi:hypothetical protein